MLLKQIGAAAITLPLRSQERCNSPFAEVDESSWPDENAEDYVKRVTLAKARFGRLLCLARSLTPLPVLAADTSVVCAGDILGKPSDDAQARQMLAKLSGGRHQVISGVALLVDDDQIEYRAATSDVWFKTLDDDTINAYIASGESRDKAGSYAIQGRAAAFIRRIEGSYSGIMGLPLFETAELLKSFGL